MNATLLYFSSYRLRQVPTAGKEDTCGIPRLVQKATEKGKTSYIRVEPGRNTKPHDVLRGQQLLLHPWAWCDAHRPQFGHINSSAGAEKLGPDDGRCQTTWFNNINTATRTRTHVLKAEYSTLSSMKSRCSGTPSRSPSPSRVSTTAYCPGSSSVPRSSLTN